jgi:hypothetical protein
MSDVKEKFDDVRLDHPWVEQYRIPVVNSFYPQYYYFATLGFPATEEEFSLDNLEVPTEEDAILMSSYIDYRIASFGFPEYYYNKIRSQKLDVDSGVNTVSIAKSKDFGWAYKRASYRDGTFPHYGSDKRFETLLELLNFIESFGGRANPAWEAWKQDHALL